MEKRTIPKTIRSEFNGTYNFFFRWEALIAKQYKGLFSRTTKEDNLELGKITIDSRWNWLAMIDRLSNGDITKHDEIYRRNYIECLNLLSYWHERDRYFEQQNEIRNRQNNYRYGK